MDGSVKKCFVSVVTVNKNLCFSNEISFSKLSGPPRLLFTLLITFENGDQMQVVSDQTWAGRAGSIKHDSIYSGEIYDSRDDRLNWTRAGFHDSLSAWITPELMPSPINISRNGSLVLQDMPPIRAGLDALHFEVAPDTQRQGYLTAEDIGEVKGVKLSDGGILKPIDAWVTVSRMFWIIQKNEFFFDISYHSGLQTFDLGQNMAGWCRLRFNGPSGYGIYIRHGEVLVEPVQSGK
jgi:alpha-L-rhamnosidase